VRWWPEQGALLLGCSGCCCRCPWLAEVAGRSQAGTTQAGGCSLPQTTVTLAYNYSPSPRHPHRPPAGANVILTTKGIDDTALKYFVEAGAIACRRVPKDDLRYGSLGLGWAGPATNAQREHGSR
jgi:hypothetical protein